MSLRAEAHLGAADTEPDAFAVKAFIMRAERAWRNLERLRT